MANFAQLGIQIDSKQAEDAASDLDNLAAAGGRAEKATDKLTKATTDWAAEQAKANARAAEMAAQEAKRAASTQKSSSAIQDQQRELAKLLGQIDPTVAALGRLDEQERKLAQFRKQGAIDSDTFNQYSRHLNEQRELLGKVDSAQRLAGLSAGQYSNAIRMLPAQFTDIFTSLAGGQNPFLVMIQQGGQVSDSFGGIGNTLEIIKDKFLSLFSISSSASSALDGISDSSSESSNSLSGLSEGLNSTSDAAGNARDALEKVPVASSAMFIGLTAAAAAVVTLAIAWKQGSDEATEFNKALILTGNSSGLTANNLAALALQMDAIAGVTTRSASKALTEVASTGEFTADQIELVATAAETMRAATGKAVGDTVAEFQKLTGDPVSAILSLNESYHFLDQTQLENIRTLVEQGRQTEAVTEAFRIHAAQLNSKSSQVVENLGSIERGWRAIKSAAAEAWDFMLDVGRDSTPDREVAVVEAQIKNIQLAAGVTGRLSASAQKEIDALQARVDKMRADLQKKPVQVTMAGIYSDAGKSQFDAQQQLEAQARSLDKVKRREYEIAEIRRKGRLAYGVGFENGKEVDDVRTQKLILDYKKQQAEIDAKKNKPKANADNNSAVTLLETAQRQVTANEQLATSGEKVTASRRLIIQIDQRVANGTNTMTAATKAQLVAVRDLLETSDAESKLAQQKTRDLAANIALTERLASAQKVQADQNEVALMGIGRGSQAAELAQRELNIRRDYLKQVNDLEKAQRNENTALTANELQVEKDMLSAHLQAQLAAEQSYQDQRMAMQADWRNGFTASFEDYSAQAANVAGQTKSLFDNAFKGAEDAMVKFAMTGKLSFKDFANSIISDLIRIAAKQAVLQIAGAIAGAFGGGAGAGVGSTQLGNNYTWAQQFGNGPKFSAGGYTGNGGKYQPAGIVHAGEVVWSQRDVAAVGGPRAANAMRPTAGYANGGGPGLPQSRGIGQMSAPQITFNMNMQDGTITSQQQGGNADDSTRELKQMFEAMINAWWTKNNRPGGAAYNMRMGTA